MSVLVYGCTHVAIEVDDGEKAVAFYKDVFNLEQMRGGEGDAFFKLGEHQFLAIFEVDKVQPANVRHFGIMVRDEDQLEEVRQKLIKKYGLTHIALAVKGAKRSFEFYRKVFGVKKVYDQGSFIQAQTPGTRDVL